MKSSTFPPRFQSFMLALLPSISAFSPPDARADRRVQPADAAAGQLAAAVEMIRRESRRKFLIRSGMGAAGVFEAL